MSARPSDPVVVDASPGELPPQRHLFPREQKANIARSARRSRIRSG
jgi:hypothetical protein